MIKTATCAAWFTLLALVASITFESPAVAADVEAYAGVPFGVGRVTIPVLTNEPVVPREDERFTVSSPSGRVLYPAIQEQPVRRILRRLLEIDRPARITIYFLFTGNEPFDLNVYAPQQQTIPVAPQPAPQGHARLLDQWWRQYSNAWRDLRQDPQFPPMIDNFLAVNLARRLNRELPRPSSGIFAAFSPKRTVWDELFLTEREQLAIDQSLLLSPGAPPGPLQPLPPPMPWYSLPAVDEEILEATPVEPIAAHVPAECVYLRFGNFTNYLWFRNLNKKWQNDLGNMVLRRAIDRGANERLEQQLSLRESALAQFLGPQVIADVAMIGLDPYLATGGAVGILFQAKSNPLLAQDLISQRRQALQKFADATEDAVRIADRDVSLISTPGGEVRSYYVQDGDFHLVTTSRRLVHRFLLAGQGEAPLAASPGFIGIRQQIPVDRDNVVFAYVSPEFFRELTSPAVWIESRRRIRSARQAKMIELARLQAAAEGSQATTLEELIAAGTLPPGFGKHFDDSELVENETGFVDSRRGASGLFVPVADMEVAAATPEEVDDYRSFAERFRQEIGQTPPIGVAVELRPLPGGGGETIGIEFLATPLDDVKLGRIPDALGEPSTSRVAPTPGDVVRLELILDAVLPLAPAEQHHLFLGLRDFHTPLLVQSGRIAPGAPTPELVRMYVGSWPKPGLIRLLLGPESAQGFEPVPGPQSTWQARREDFLLISFKPDLVREVLPQLAMVETEQPAQARLEIADLSQTELRAAINALGYQAARQTAVAASRLMNTLSNQLHVPPAQARDVAEELMDGKFISPMGGDYELVETAGDQQMWTVSTLIPQNRFQLTAAPEDFSFPLLEWFRGARARALLEDNQARAHIEVDMAASAIP